MIRNLVAWLLALTALGLGLATLEVCAENAEIAGRLHRERARREALATSIRAMRARTSAHVPGAPAPELPPEPGERPDRPTEAGLQ